MADYNRHQYEEDQQTNEFTDANWIVRETKYWEAVHDRVIVELLETKAQRDEWRAAHDRASAAVEQHEEWQEGLKKEIEILRSDIIVHEEWIEKLKRGNELWEAEHRNVVANSERQISEIKQERDSWQSEHAKAVANAEKTINELKRARDLWEEEHRKAVANNSVVIAELKQARDFWEQEHGKVVAQVKVWEDRYKSLQVDREQWKTWHSGLRNEINLLHADLEAQTKWVDELKRGRDRWQAEHGKVVMQVQQWEEWFLSMNKERDQVLQWLEDQKETNGQLQQTLDEMVRSRNIWQDEHRNVERQLQALIKSPLLYFKTWWDSRF